MKGGWIRKAATPQQTLEALQHLHTVGTDPHDGRQLAWNFLGKTNTPGGEVWRRDYMEAMKKAISECQQWAITPARKPLVSAAIDEAIAVVNELDTIERDLQSQRDEAISKIERSGKDQKDIQRETDEIEKAEAKNRELVVRLHHYLVDR
jgi:DNA-binding transcriptional regulator GbsR (MarR family)